MHVEKRLSGVHPAEEAVQDCLGADNVAVLVRLNASEQQVLEVFLHQEEAAEREGLRIRNSRSTAWKQPLPHVLIVYLVEDFIPRQTLYFPVDGLVKHAVFSPQLENAVLKAGGGQA